MTYRWEERLWPRGDVDQSRVEKDAVALEPPDVRYAPRAVAARQGRDRRMALRLVQAAAVRDRNQ
jgi:hypothetical protein